MGTRARGLVDAAAGLLLGAACPCCGVPSWGPCAGCGAELADPRPCPVTASGVSPVGVPVWAASAYEGVWRGAIVAYKERRAWHLVRPLGDALALGVAAALARDEAGPGVRGEGGGVLLVPLPSRGAAVRERGLDVTAALAARAASALTQAGLSARVERSLVLARGGVDQGGLGAAGRWQNRAGSLVARPGPQARRVVVDDITTTGASLVAAVSALAAAGVPARAAAVVAATPRRDGTR